MTDLYQNVNPRAFNMIVSTNSKPDRRVINSNTPATSRVRTEEIFSSEDQTTDYLSIQGLNTRFGLDGTDFEIFIIKEMMDNALDYIEQNAQKFAQLNEGIPFIDVVVAEENDEVVKIIVTNSNASNENIFSEDQIQKIFNLKEYYSSKRYRHQINRGELGDAFKAILCIPYAIAVNDHSNIYENWDYPLKINISNKRLIEVKIDNFDKIRKKENVRVKAEFKQISDETKSQSYFTEITVYIPKISADYDKIRQILKRYAVINTHIIFDFKIANKETGIYEYSWLLTQKIKHDWKNRLSIYSYSLPDFRDLILSIKDRDDLNVYDDLIRPHFREGGSLPKEDQFKTLAYKDLKSDMNKIEVVYNKLKNNQTSIKHQSSRRIPFLDVPFDIEKTSRENGLRVRLQQVYDIDKDSFVYKKFDRCYYQNLEKGVEFPYILEIAIAKSPMFPKKRLTLIESLNCSPGLYSDSLFHANEPIFNWTQKNGEVWNGYSIAGVLENCGYSVENEKKHKKIHNLILINLISPRIDYSSHSKSSIKLESFAEMTQKVYTFCKESHRKKTSDDNTLNNMHYLRIILQDRYYAVKNNPILKTPKYRWTQSTVYYILRKILDEKGIPIADRDYITGEIKVECEQLGMRLIGRKTP